jgi:hypothetical protein
MSPECAARHTGSADRPVNTGLEELRRSCVAVGLTDWARATLISQR